MQFYPNNERSNHCFEDKTVVVNRADCDNARNSPKHQVLESYCIVFHL